MVFLKHTKSYEDIKTDEGKRALDVLYVCPNPIPNVSYPFAHRIDEEKKATNLETLPRRLERTIDQLFEKKYECLPSHEEFVQDVHCMLCTLELYMRVYGNMFG